MTSTRPKRTAEKLEAPNGHFATVSPQPLTLTHSRTYRLDVRSVSLTSVLMGVLVHRPCVVSSQDVNVVARSASPLPGGAVRSSGRDRKPVKEFVITAAEPELATATNHTTIAMPPTAAATTAPPSKRTTHTAARKSSLSSLPTSPASASTSSTPKRPRQFDELTGEQLFCICRQPYDSRRFMIGCDDCDGWFHAKCVNLSKAEAEDSKQWRCPDCVKRDGATAGAKAAAEGRRRAGKIGKNGKRKEADGADDDGLTDEASNGLSRGKENNPTVKDEFREDELLPTDEVVRLQFHHNGAATDSGSVLKAIKSDKSKDRDRDRDNRAAAGKGGKDRAAGAKSDKSERGVDKLAKAKRKRDRESRRERSGANATTHDRDRDRDRKKEAKRSDRDAAATSSTTNGLVSNKRRDRDDEDGKKRRRVDRDDGPRHADGKSERRRDRDRLLPPGSMLSDSDTSEADDVRYSWLAQEERDSSSGDSDVYLTSDDDAGEAEADEADIDAVWIARDESALFDDWKRSGLTERKTMEEDEEETALEAISVKPQTADEQREVVPFGSLSLRARTLLSPFSMSAGENTREVFLAALLSDNDSASLPPSSPSTSASALSSASVSASSLSSSFVPSSAADFTMSSPPSVDDLDHLHLHRLHNAKMRVECELLRLEQDRRVYLAGVDYSARMSVMRTMEAFDRRATESVLLEEVEVDEETAKEKERERERLEAEAAGRGSVGGGGGVGMDVMSSPRVVFPFTPRPPSLSRRPSTNSLTSLPSFSTASDSISPPLYGTTLTCCGCDGLIPVAIYHQHLLECAMTAQEAGQQDWIHEAMTYISGQWEEGRPIGGGDQRKKVSAEYSGYLATTVNNDSKRKDRSKPLAPTTERGADERADGRTDRSTASERQSEKERERIQQREAAYNRQHLKSNPTPVGTAANRVQGLLPLPPLLHPYPTIPQIRPLRHRTVAATRHSADWERDRERQQEREEEMRREERRRGTKHDKHSLSLNSVSGRFPLQLSHLRLVCGYPMPSSSKPGQQYTYVYCSREKRECTAHLLWEEVEKVRVEQRYWQLSRRLEMLKAELEPVQFRVSERVMCEADVIGQVLGDSILVEEAEDENLKEEAERMVVLARRRKEDEDKTTQAKAERESDEKNARHPAATALNDDRRLLSTTPAAAAAVAMALSSPSTAAAAEAKRAQRRASADMDVDEHEGFAMSTSVSDVDHSSPTAHHAHPPVVPSTAYMHAHPGFWMGESPPVRTHPHFAAMEPTAAAFVTAAGFGNAQHASSAVLPPPPPTHPQPLRVQTAGLGSPASGSPSGVAAVMGSSSGASAFSPPARSAATAVDSASATAIDGGSAGASSTSSTPSSSSLSPTAVSPASTLSPSKPTTPSVAAPPASSLPPPPPPPPIPVQATLAINANPTIPRSLAPATLVSPHSVPAHTTASTNGPTSAASADKAVAAVEGSSKHVDGSTPTAAEQFAIVQQPAVTSVAT